jgi:hypothetical protein
MISLSASLDSIKNLFNRDPTRKRKRDGDEPEDNGFPDSENNAQEEMPWSSTRQQPTHQMKWRARHKGTRAEPQRQVQSHRAPAAEGKNVRPQSISDPYHKSTPASPLIDRPAISETMSTVSSPDIQYTKARQPGQRVERSPPQRKRRKVRSPPPIKLATATSPERVAQQARRKSFLRIPYGGDMSNADIEGYARQLQIRAPGSSFSPAFREQIADPKSPLRIFVRDWSEDVARKKQEMDEAVTSRKGMIEEAQRLLKASNNVFAGYHRSQPRNEDIKAQVTPAEHVKKPVSPDAISPSSEPLRTSNQRDSRVSIGSDKSSALKKAEVPPIRAGINEVGHSGLHTATGGSHRSDTSSDVTAVLHKELLASIAAYVKATNESNQLAITNNVQTQQLITRLLTSIPTAPQQVPQAVAAEPINTQAEPHQVHLLQQWHEWARTVLGRPREQSSYLDTKKRAGVWTSDQLDLLKNVWEKRYGDDLNKCALQKALKHPRRQIHLLPFVQYFDLSKYEPSLWDKNLDPIPVTWSPRRSEPMEDVRSTYSQTWQGQEPTFNNSGWALNIPCQNEVQGRVCTTPGCILMHNSIPRQPSDALDTELVELRNKVFSIISSSADDMRQNNRLAQIVKILQERVAAVRVVLENCSSDRVSQSHFSDQNTMVLDKLLKDWWLRITGSRGMPPELFGAVGTLSLLIHQASKIMKGEWQRNGNNNNNGNNNRNANQQSNFTNQNPFQNGSRRTQPQPQLQQYQVMADRAVQDQPFSQPRPPANFSSTNYFQQAQQVDSSLQRPNEANHLANNLGSNPFLQATPPPRQPHNEQQRRQMQEDTRVLREADQLFEELNGNGNGYTADAEESDPSPRTGNISSINYFQQSQQSQFLPPNDRARQAALRAGIDEILRLPSRIDGGHGDNRRNDTQQPRQPQQPIQRQNVFLQGLDGILASASSRVPSNMFGGAVDPRNESHHDHNNNDRNGRGNGRRNRRGGRYDHIAVSTYTYPNAFLRVESITNTKQSLFPPLDISNAAPAPASRPAQRPLQRSFGLQVAQPGEDEWL